MVDALPPALVQVRCEGEGNGLGKQVGGARPGRVRRVRGGGGEGGGTRDRRRCNMHICAAERHVHCVHGVDRGELQQRRATRGPASTLAHPRGGGGLLPDDPNPAAPVLCLLPQAVHMAREPAGVADAMLVKVGVKNCACGVRCAMLAGCCVPVSVGVRAGAVGSLTAC